MKFLGIEEHVISNCPIIDHIQIILQVVTILDISYFTVDSSVIGKTNEHTEVTPKNNRYTLQKSELEIKGFNLFITNFNDKDSRGVAIYVIIKKSIISNKIEIENMANETVWVEITVETNIKHVN